MTTPEPPALRKTASVRSDPAAAFALFTDHLDEWWPLATHSVGRGDATSVVFEHGVGGRIVETLADGSTAVWGTVLVWDPPARVRFTWHPGTREDEATEVEVSFSASPEGTRVELVHTGWARRPDGGAARGSYDTGWDHVLGRFAALGHGTLTPTSPT
ncbi:MAG TPA: SRPBCC family protein [Acidimicrobiales bacterium]|nr:SRPBCC family protein [Acidimicrobiales bacterium]